MVTLDAGSWALQASRLRARLLPEARRPAAMCVGAAQMHQSTRRACQAVHDPGAALATPDVPLDDDILFARRRAAARKLEPSAYAMPNARPAR